MIYRMKDFVREEGFDRIPELFVAAISLDKNGFEILLFSFLRFLQRFLAFFSSKKCYLEGHFEYLFFILNLSIIALFSFFEISIYL